MQRIYKFKLVLPIKEEIFLNYAKTNIKQLFQNTNAFDFILKYWDELKIDLHCSLNDDDWTSLLSKENGHYIILNKWREIKHKIKWFNEPLIWRRESAARLIEECEYDRELWEYIQDIVDWIEAYRNEHLNTIIAEHLRDDQLQFYEYKILCLNKSAFKLIEPNFEQLLKENKICWKSLSSNENAIHIIETYFDKYKHEMDLSSLFKFNKNSIPLLRANWQECKKHVNAYHLCSISNPDAMNLLNEKWEELKHGLHEYSLIKLCANPNAIPIIQTRWEEIEHCIEWVFLCTNPNAIPLIELKWNEIQDKINWFTLSQNPNAIPLFLSKWSHEIRDKIVWTELCANPNVIPLIISKWDVIQDHIVWSKLCANQNAIDFIISKWDYLIEYHKINWTMLCSNTNIFASKVDYDACRSNRKVMVNDQEINISEQIIANRFHPKQMSNWINWGFEESCFEED